MTSIRSVAVALMIAKSGCTSTGVTRTMLIASTASLACDWMQTRDQAESGWVQYTETNPMLGETPSTARVDTYFLSAIAINALAWYVIPAKFRAVIPAGVTAREGLAISRNVGHGIGMCGIGPTHFTPDPTLAGQSSR